MHIRMGKKCLFIFDISGVFPYFGYIVGSKGLNIGS